MAALNVKDGTSLPTKLSSDKLGNVVPKLELVKMLNRSELMYACVDNNFPKVESLLANGVDVNSLDDNKWSALHFAVQVQSIDIVETLVDHGANIEASDKHGNTPLNKAVFCYRGDGAIIEFLLNKGADPTKKNYHGVTPEELASNIANYDALKFFVGHQ